ncbi:DUF3244 domain-containing protein [uncultured Bacteroides sp.]|uniref:DUF3244 domain-containing protein n=1 Tax=uncultured Bacteroides sp. TaxID=162156 RepID=UPI002AA670B0|nr:DUF3244 domain-containing protein [uncultured Bacteroides sp.]
MKHLLLGCFFVLFCINAFAEEVNIDLEKDNQTTSTRSLTVDPTVTHDGNIVYIYYSDYLLANLQITVKDLSGNAVYSNTVSVSCNQPYSFVLNNVENGDYEIELSYGNMLLYGYFLIEMIA